MAYTQDNRPLRVATALGKDVLLLERFSGEEGVSAPFRFTLDLLSDPAALEEIRAARDDIARGRVVSAEELRAKYLGR